MKNACNGVPTARIGLDDDQTIELELSGEEIIGLSRAAPATSPSVEISQISLEDLLEPP